MVHYLGVRFTFQSLLGAPLGAPADRLQHIQGTTPFKAEAAQVNRGHWGGLAGAPLGALAHLLAAWLGGFREPVLTGAALTAVLRLAAVLAEVCALSTCRVYLGF